MAAMCRAAAWQRVQAMAQSTRAAHVQITPTSCTRFLSEAIPRERRRLALSIGVCMVSIGQEKVVLRWKIVLADFRTQPFS